MIEAAIYSRLSNHVGLTAIVGSRIYPAHLPQSAAYPALVYTLVSNTHRHNLTGASGGALARFQFDVFSVRLADCVEAVEQIRLALQGFRGTVAGVNICFGRLDNEQDLSEPPQDGSDQWTYRKTADYIIHYKI